MVDDQTVLHGFIRRIFRKECFPCPFELDFLLQIGCPDIKKAELDKAMMGTWIFGEGSEQKTDDSGLWRNGPSGSASIGQRQYVTRRLHSNSSKPSKMLSAAVTIVRPSIHAGNDVPW